jgi:hypothetical protein
MFFWINIIALMVPDQLVSKFWISNPASPDFSSNFIVFSNISYSIILVISYVYNFFQNKYKK